MGCRSSGVVEMLAFCPALGRDYTAHLKLCCGPDSMNSVIRGFVLHTAIAVRDRT
jgi:hypothetical protein